MKKAKTKKRPMLEIRPQSDNQTLIDEIVASDVELVHIEQMSDDEYWMGIYFNNKKERLSVSFQAVGNKLNILAELEEI